jgi:two-component system sensor histidine kinase RegB
MGQAATIWVAYELGVVIAWVPCVASLLFTLVSNVILIWWRRAMGGHLGGAIFHVALWDILSLTLLLYWTGGIENPFVMFFLVQLTIATVALRASAVSGLAAMMAGACVFLWFFHHPLEMRVGGPFPRQLHFAGEMAALFLAGGTILLLLLSVRNLTQRLQKERELLRAELESRDRFLSVAALATGFAHELATPLATISIAVEELEASGAGGAAALIAREARRCELVLERLRSVGQEAVCHSGENVAIGSVIHEVLDQLDCADHDRIDLSVSGGDALVQCAGLREALLVLLRNALLSSGAESRIGFAVKVKGTTAIFRVQDEGPGFDPTMLRHWGEPFRSTRADGLGLGLFFVRRLAAATGGELEVGNAPIRGAIVTLILPLQSKFGTES